MTVPSINGRSGDGRLTVLIVGAGIGGLAAACGLSRARHHVKVYDKSTLTHEVGAAISLPPKIRGLLLKLGMNVEQWGVTSQEMMTRHDKEGRVLMQVNLRNQKPGIPPAPVTQMIHRVDLHEGLRSAAAASGVEINAKSKVSSVDVEAGTILFEDGTTATGDLVIGGDGIWSTVRKYIAQPGLQPSPFGISVFRMIIPTSLIASNPQTRKVVETPGHMIYYTAENGRGVVCYPCRNNTLLNIVALFPERFAKPDPADPNLKQIMLDVYHDFCEEARSLFQLADKLWRIYDLPELETWSRGKATLLGDAAHPILPYGAWGGAGAIEDAVTLAVVLPEGTPPNQVPMRLKAYHQIRRKRASWVQEYAREIGSFVLDQSKELSVDYSEYQKAVAVHDAWSHAESAWTELQRTMTA